MTTQDKLETFRAVLEAAQIQGLKTMGITYAGSEQSVACTIKLGARYARVDVGHSGKYMIPLDTEEIFGIKGYGVIHRGYRFGTLDTTSEYDWSGYRASRRPQP